jgi:hypothetical protein
VGRSKATCSGLGVPHWALMLHYELRRMHPAQATAALARLPSPPPIQAVTRDDDRPKLREPTWPSKPLYGNGWRRKDKHSYCTMWIPRTTADLIGRPQVWPEKLAIQMSYSN